MSEPISCPPLTQYKSAEQCPDRAKHTSDPPGYLAWHEWAEKKARTHGQFQCPTCGFWAIWKRKPKVALAGIEQPTGSGRPSLFPSHRRHA